MGRKLKEKGSSSWWPMWTQSGTDKSQISFHGVYKAPHGGLGLHAADQCKQSPSIGPLLAPFGRPPSAFYTPLSILHSRHSDESSVYTLSLLRVGHIWKRTLAKRRLTLLFFIFILSDPLQKYCWPQSCLVSLDISVEDCEGLWTEIESLSIFTYQGNVEFAVPNFTLLMSHRS